MFDKINIKLSAVVYFLSDSFELIPDEMYQHRFHLSTFSFNDEKSISEEVNRFKRFVYEKLGISYNDKWYILCEFCVDVYNHLVKCDRYVLGVNEYSTNEKGLQNKINALFKMMMF